MGFTLIASQDVSITMTDRSETIGIRVTPEERDKFEKFLENSDEFDSLSRFLRTIAHRHIATSDETQSVDPEEIIDAVDSAIAPLSERLERVEDHVTSIDSNVRNDDKIDRLARDIYSSLPEHRSGDELPDSNQIDQYNNASDLAIAQAISTPYIWAQYYDEDHADARRACARMLEYYPDVKYVSQNISGPDSSVPSHDDLNIGHTPSHTDTFSDSKSGSRPSNSLSNSQDQGTERRYFKTGGD